MNSLLKSKTTRWLFVGIALLFLAACTQPGDNGNGDGNGVPDSVTLTVNVDGNGTVAAVDEGGEAVVVTGDDKTTFNPEEEAVVTVTATPAEGWEFTGWSGDTTCTTAECDVVMNDDRTLTATFTEEEDPGDPGDPGEPGEEQTESFNAQAAAEELVSPASAFSDGHTYTDSSDLELVYDDGTHATEQVVGVRFIDVSLPENAEIQSAVLRFVAHTNPGTAGALTLDIAGEAEASAAPFENQSNDSSVTGNFDVSSRSTTGATVEWVIDTAWTAAESYNSADVSDILAEVMAIEGWDGSVVFVITGDGSSTELRRAMPAGASGPQLVINYTVPGDTGEGGDDGEGEGAAG